MASYFFLDAPEFECYDIISEEALKLLDSLLGAGEVMRNWVANLLLYEKTGEAGKCPYCSSDEVKSEIHNYGRRSVTFQCEKCGKSEHFDGITEANKKKYPIRFHLS